MTRKVLITGGAGYIGSHTAVELLAAGYDVVLVDSLVNSSVNVVEAIRRIAGVEVPFVEVDCSDRVALGRVFERWRFDAVIHFAALKSVPESVREPLRYYRNNVESLITLLDVMGDRGVSVRLGVWRTGVVARQRKYAAHGAHFPIRSHEAGV